MCLSSCHLYAQKPSRASIFYNKVQISKHGIPSPINLVDSYLARLLTSSALRRPQCILSFVFCRNRLACLFSSLIGLAKSFPSYQGWLKMPPHQRNVSRILLPHFISKIISPLLWSPYNI